MCFFNCVDSLLAYHNGAIITTLSKNDVPFDVGDKCSQSIALFREQNATDFIHVSNLLFAFMLQLLFKTTPLLNFSRTNKDM